MDRAETLVSMMGPPPEIGVPAYALALKSLLRRDGRRVVLRVKSDWAAGVALAEAINALCDGVSLRPRGDDDRMIDKLRGWVHREPGSAYLSAPPGHNDRDPLLIEFHTTLDGAAHVVAFALKPAVSWSEGENLATRIKETCRAIDILSRR